MLARDLMWELKTARSPDRSCPSANIPLSSSGRLYLCACPQIGSGEGIFSIFPGHNFLCVAPVCCRIWKCHLMQNPEIGNFWIPTWRVRWTLWIWPLGAGTKGRVSWARQQTHFVSLIFWVRFSPSQNIFLASDGCRRVISTLGRITLHSICSVSDKLVF